MVLLTSLQREYDSTWKKNVGPRGARAIRKFVFPLLDREKSSKWETPSGPAIVV